MNKIKILISVVAAFSIFGCGQQNTPEGVVENFFKDSKQAESSEVLKKYLTGEAATNLEQRFQNLKSMHENYTVNLSILERSESDNGNVRLKAKIEFTDDSGKGMMNEVFSLSESEGRWLITKIGGPFKDFDIQELKDSQKNTPFDYAKEYFEAMNQGNTDKMKTMHTAAHYESIVTRRGFLKEPDPSLLEKEIKKTESFLLNEKRTELLDDVFRAKFEITLTDEFAKEYGDRYLGGKFFKGPAGYTIYFRLDEGVWRITNKDGI